MKRDHLSSECNGCASEERFLLHNVRHRGTFRRLCTACVLKNHSDSFCPICFHVFDELPRPHDRVMCFKCPSISHLSCVGFHVVPRYECPPCANPNFSFFDLRVSNKRIKGNDGESAPDDTAREINKDSAKALLAAARIASASMTKAAAVTRVEAERRVKEATLAKKRAREALERVAYLVSKEKNKDSTGIVNRGSVSVARQKMKHELDSLVSAQKRIQNQVKAEIPEAIQKRLGLLAKKDINGISVEGIDKQTHNVRGEKDTNGLASVSPVAGHLQHQRSSHGNED